MFSFFSTILSGYLLGVSGKFNDDVASKLQACRRGKVSSCYGFQSFDLDNNDNGYCATFDPSGDAGVFNAYCRVYDEGCHNRGEVKNGAVVLAVDPSNALELIADLSADVLRKLGDGPRRELLDVASSHAFGCMMWAQLSYPDSGAVYPSDGWSYSQDTKTCTLYTDLDPSNVKKSFEGVKEKWLKKHTRLTVGARHCGCAYDQDKYECRPLGDDDTELVSKCYDDPSSEGCRKIDTVDNNSGAETCFTGQWGDYCAYSEEIPKQCYAELDGDASGYVATLDKLNPMPADAAGVRQWLIDAANGDFWDFAGRVGFSKDDRDAKDLSPRSKTVVPDLTGAAACRYVIEMMGSKSGKSPVGDREYFIFDHESHECWFVNKATPTPAPGPVSWDESSHGPVWCDLSKAAPMS